MLVVVSLFTFFRLTMIFSTALFAFATALSFHVCGSTHLELMEGSASRIVNGIIADYSQFPYAISLQQISKLSQATRGHTCGGALVTLQHAVTSGSCLYVGNGSFILKTPSQYRVFAGASVLTNDTSSDRYRSVSAFTPHPNYTGSTNYTYDIGIITVATPFSKGAIVPLSVSTAVPADNIQCTVAGWGATLAGGQASPNLLFVNRVTVNQTTCGSLSVAAGGPAVQTHMLCTANAATFTPSCTNDTGNPLVCGGVLTGVLSWHTTCSLSSTIEVYTRTASFATWINGTTNAANTYSPVTALLIAVAVMTRIFSTTSVLC